MSGYNRNYSQNDSHVNGGGDRRPSNTPSTLPTPLNLSLPARPTASAIPPSHSHHSNSQPHPPARDPVKILFGIKGAATTGPITPSSSRGAPSSSYNNNNNNNNNSYSSGPPPLPSNPPPPPPPPTPLPAPPGAIVSIKGQGGQSRSSSSREHTPDPVTTNPMSVSISSNLKQSSRTAGPILPTSLPPIPLSSQKPPSSLPSKPPPKTEDGDRSPPKSSSSILDRVLGVDRMQVEGEDHELGEIPEERREVEKVVVKKIEERVEVKLAKVEERVQDEARTKKVEEKVQRVEEKVHKVEEKARKVDERVDEEGDTGMKELEERSSDLGGERERDKKRHSSGSSRRRFHGKDREEREDRSRSRERPDKHRSERGERDSKPRERDYDREKEKEKERERRDRHRRESSISKDEVERDDRAKRESTATSHHSRHGGEKRTREHRDRDRDEESSSRHHHSTKRSKRSPSPRRRLSDSSRRDARSRSRSRSRSPPPPRSSSSRSQLPSRPLSPPPLSRHAPLPPPRRRSRSRSPYRNQSNTSSSYYTGANNGNYRRREDEPYSPERLRDDRSRDGRSYPPPDRRRDRPRSPSPPPAYSDRNRETRRYNDEPRAAGRIGGNRELSPILPRRDSYVEQKASTRPPPFVGGDTPPRGVEQDLSSGRRDQHQPQPQPPNRNLRKPQESEEPPSLLARIAPISLPKPSPTNVRNPTSLAVFSKNRLPAKPAPDVIAAAVPPPPSVAPPPPPPSNPPPPPPMPPLASNYVPLVNPRPFQRQTPYPPVPPQVQYQSLPPQTAPFAFPPPFQVQPGFPPFVRNEAPHAPPHPPLPATSNQPSLPPTPNLIPPEMNGSHTPALGTTSSSTSSSFPSPNPNRQQPDYPVIPLRTSNRNAVAGPLVDKPHKTLQGEVPEQPSSSSSLKIKSEKDGGDEKGFVGASEIGEYDLKEKLGEGTFGVVWKGIRKNDDRGRVKKGQVVALKEILVHNESDGMPITSLREIRILKALDHPNVVPCVDIAFQIGDAQKFILGKTFMVFPYMDHDLTGLLENPSVRLSDPVIKQYSKQLLQGTAYLHQNKILHRDMKAANLLINNEGVLMIADFGLARSIHRASLGREYTNFVVTRWYRPPELLLGERKYHNAVDMWGVGCVIMEMYKKTPYFPGTSDTDQADKIFAICGSPDEISMPGFGKLPGIEERKIWTRRGRILKHECNLMGGEVFADLMDKILRLDPKARLTAAQALDHEWFWSEPLPADPKTMPTYASSHEFDKRKREEAAFGQAQHRPLPVAAPAPMYIPPNGGRQGPPPFQNQQQQQQQYQQGGNQGGPGWYPNQQQQQLQQNGPPFGGNGQFQRQQGFNHHPNINMNNNLNNNHNQHRGGRPFNRGGHQNQPPSAAPKLNLAQLAAASRNAGGSQQGPGGR